MRGTDPASEQRALPRKHGDIRGKQRCSKLEATLTGASYTMQQLLSTTVYINSAPLCAAVTQNPARLHRAIYLD